MKKINTSLLKNRFLAFILALSVAILYMPRFTVFDITAEAADDYTCGDYKFTVNNNGTATITDYIGSDTDISIPSTVTDEKGNDYTVTDIGEYAFKDYSSLTSVSIPNSVTSIGISAFAGCINLKSVNIPEDVTIIRTATFSGCSRLSEIKLPDSITTISYSSFANCKNLEKLEIPKCLSLLKMQAFSGCSNLSTITVDEENEHFTSVNNILFSKDLTILYFYPSKCGSSYNIPDTVTTIASAFSDCENLISVNIPDSVEHIGAYAFFNCSNLSNITIPDSVIRIGSNSFKGCERLIDIDIPDSVTEIGDGAFSNCINLENINIPKGITMIDSYVFSGCSSLSTIEIPNSVTWVGGDSFENCTSLKSVVIPESVSFIDFNAFDGCENLTIYGYTNSYAETYAIENNIPFVAIDDTETDVPKSGKCGNDVYWEFTDENTLNIYGTGSMWDYNYSASLPSTLSKFDIDTIYINDGVTYIGSNAFWGCTAENVFIPDSVESIGTYAFDGCQYISKVVIPDTVKEIGINAFRGCENLKNIIIGKGITTLSQSIFEGCISLKEIEIPENITAIGNYAFYGCTSLETLEIPESVTTIGAYSFNSCSNLTKMLMPKSVVEIYHYAFDDCPNLTFELYKGSYVEEYAIAHNIPYNIIGETVTPTPITGTISGIDAGEEITVQLLDSNKNVIETVTSTDGSYSFNTNTNGEEYFILVSMPKCAPREYSLTGSGTAQTLDMEIRQYGDIHPDGVIDAKDATQILRYEAGLTSAFDSGDEYILTVANVVSTDELSAKDATQILRYEAGMTSVFDTLS